MKRKFTHSKASAPAFGARRLLGSSMLEDKMGYSSHERVVRHINLYGSIPRSLLRSLVTQYPASLLRGRLLRRRSAGRLEGQFNARLESLWCIGSTQI